MWSLGALLLFSSISIKNTLAYSSLAELESDSKLLSRQRRFLIPNVTSDWTFTVKFTLAFPLEGLDTSFSGSVPFAFDFNPSRYVIHAILSYKHCTHISTRKNIEIWVPAFFKHNNSSVATVPQTCPPPPVPTALPKCGNFIQSV